MEVPHPEIWLSILFVGSIVGCLTVWAFLLRRWRIQGRFLPYESRRPVPWNFIAALPAFLFAILAAINAFERLGEPREIAVKDFVLGITQMLLFAIVVFVLVVVAARPSWQDLGLPQSFRQLCSDFLLGSLGFLACLLPVIGLQALLTYLFRTSSQNPVIKMVEESPNLPQLVFAFVSAVIFAPITEEIYFRLLLQGWLEKVEDSPVPRESAPVSEVVANSEEVEGTAETGVVSQGARSESFEFCELDSTPKWWHGMLPIAISSVVFALAHVGNGPDPWAIFVLALFLGYLYHRTHRIVPCIVLHMLFNGLSLLYLWLYLQVPKPPEMPFS